MREQPLAPDEVNWQADPWFAEQWAPRLTEAFKAWWLQAYGDPLMYHDVEGYWLRCGFALRGWLGREEAG